LSKRRKDGWQPHLGGKKGKKIRKLEPFRKVSKIKQTISGQKGGKPRTGGPNLPGETVGEEHSILRKFIEGKKKYKGGR